MDINNLSGHDFEDLVEKLIKQLGFITEERKRSADGGIDIRAINEQPILKGLYIIQCKRYSNTISESIIRDLFGVVTSERANKGILITNSTFSKAAKNFASNLPLELIDGHKLIELFEKNLNKKFEKEPEENLMPEKYRIVFEYLDAEEKRISKRRKDISDKRIYLEPKFYNNIEIYNNYFMKKFNKLPKITEVLISQINNLTNIWNSFSENQSNYKNIQELKNQCSEITKTMNLVENEQEELISINPPNNLIRLHAAQINMYNPLFKYFSDFLYRLSLTAIENLEDPRLKKYLTNENGKQVINMHFDIPFDEELKAISRETQFVTRELQKFNKAKGKRCYIATVVYKDANAPEVMKLRQWRDNVLCNNIFGKLIIEIYYFSGKYFANWINKFPVLKRIIKYFLDLIISKLEK